MAQVWKRWKMNYLPDLKQAHRYRQIDKPSELIEDNCRSQGEEHLEIHLENRCYNTNSSWK